MTYTKKHVKLNMIVDVRSDPRLSGKSISLTGVFLFMWVWNFAYTKEAEERSVQMIVRDGNGNELLAVIDVPEEQAEKQYSPVTHALLVVKIGEEYLLGWNRWRQDWEIFGGCKEEGENIRQCIERECEEELGLKGVEYSYLGLMQYKMAPGYFNPEWHEEYGALYGVTLPLSALKEIEAARMDKEEIERLAFYSQVRGKEKIAEIDEKLLEYWK